MSVYVRPAEAWPSKEEHMLKYKVLAGRFVENMKHFTSSQYKEQIEPILHAGPKV
jgi:ATP-dependent phosphoenolpyruvate carboxykinase